VIDTIVSEALRRHAPRTALADTTRSFSYAELDAFATELAADLRPWLSAGRPTRVGLLAGNSAEYVAIYLALLRSGCVPFLVDAAATATELRTITDDCGLDLLVQESPVPVLPSAVVRGPLGRHTVVAPGASGPVPGLRPDTEVCRFTSGSTGKPNCIEFSGRAVARAAVNWAEGTGLSEDDRIACFASLSNGLAFNTSLLASLLAGSELRLHRGLPTAGSVVRALAQGRATRLVGFPALYESVVRTAASTDALRGLRFAISSAAPLSAEVGARFTELTGVRIRDYYGTAETGPLTFDAGAAGTVPAPGLGPALPGVSLRAGSGPGEPDTILVRSQSMGSGYLNAPGAFEARLDEEGWFRTGDVGYLSGGSLVLTGRTSHMLNVGGRKIDSTEVARVLLEVPGVADAVVLEAPSRHGAPMVAAVVTGDAGLPDPAELRRHAAERLAAYKVPTAIRVVAEIPRGTTGKPALPRLRQLFDPVSRQD